MNTQTSPPPAPRVVRRAHHLWLLAVLAGVLETGLALADAYLGPGIDGGALVAQLVIRSAVFGVAVFLAFRMRTGSNAARWALTALLGVLGLASLLVGPVQWIAAGHGLSDLQFTALGWVFAASRLAHIVAVVLAVILMFTPPANRWFQRRAAPIEALA